MDIGAVAGHLGVKVRHVRKLVTQRRIPYIKWGNLLRFDPNAVATRLEEKIVPKAQVDGRCGHADAAHQLIRNQVKRF